MSFPTTVLHTSSRRRTQRGAFRVDVLMLILVGVAILGLGAYWFMLNGKNTEDEMYVEKMEALAKRPEAEFVRLVQVAKDASVPMGFRGDDGLPEISLITKLGDMIKAHEFEVTTVAEVSLKPGQDNSIFETDSSDQIVFAANRLQTRKSSSKEITGTPVLKSILDDQDSRIRNHLADLANWNTARGRELERSADALADLSSRQENAETSYATSRNDAMTQANARITNFENEGSNLVQKNAGANRFVTEKLSEADAANTDYRTVQEGLKDETVAIAKIRQATGELVGERIDDMADLGEYIGTVMMVDETNGWIWINLGQRDNLRTETPFSVFRPQPGGSSDRKIADIRVKEILDGRYSRCRIDSLELQDNLPRVGDSIKNVNFSRYQYTNFAFAGVFGAGYTKYSRQQLTRMLREKGRNVVESTDEVVEVIIMGGKAMEDKKFADRDENISFIPWSEADVLHMLQVTGPGSE